ncbi:uncharacterized protein SCHCODRAFT_02349942 [Schizophyllum commune H4-8]|uniref:uncharacterized protein n=1 Tax=Schizophyllum commune (strain H4-8 / FGSC 9210) TaxID=578458 RepID=UPI002160F9FC|nr:uncharacterized protein SCHCODRAFT_02349942 [Schizophyllum commune H4-8]KAI5890645.1 hypothetical protein SCHCODRAFT_02349942 [Schizophyllum commune H4-8]
MLLCSFSLRYVDVPNTFLSSLRRLSIARLKIANRLNTEHRTLFCHLPRRDCKFNHGAYSPRCRLTALKRRSLRMISIADINRKCRSGRQCQRTHRTIGSHRGRAAHEQHRHNGKQDRERESKPGREVSSGKQSTNS